MAPVSIWEVVGGGKQGGILVREGQQLASPPAKERLATGAVVEELGLAGDRLRFAKITGGGPQEGWVSLAAAGQPLVARRPLSADALGPEQGLTQTQCRIAQHMLRGALRQAEVQAKVREIEEASKGNGDLFQKKLNGVLLMKVYPPIVQRFGFEDPIAGAQKVFGSIVVNQPFSLEITEAWMELETLMRSKQGMERARAALSAFAPHAPLHGPAEPGPQAPDWDGEGDGREDREILGLDGKILGVVDAGRIFGGCKVSGCPAFRPPIPGAGAARLCRRCGRARAEHDDMGPFQEDDSDEEHEEQEPSRAAVPMTVRVTCEVVPRGSISSILHVVLPAGATVSDLRAELSWGLPRTARVFRPVAAGGRAGPPLQDAQPVPPHVAVSELVERVRSSHVLTKEQAQEAQAFLLARYGEPKFQSRLDVFEATAPADKAEYGLKLTAMLLEDVYPPLNRKLGLPADATRALLAAVQHHTVSDEGMVKTWAKLENLLRRSDGAAQAGMTLRMLQAAPHVSDQERLLGA